MSWHVMAGCRTLVLFLDIYAVQTAKPKIVPMYFYIDGILFVISSFIVRSRLLYLCRGVAPPGVFLELTCDWTALSWRDNSFKSVCDLGEWETPRRLIEKTVSISHSIVMSNVLRLIYTATALLLWRPLSHNDLDLDI